MKINIINQTHWDREWYKSLEEFKFRLKDGIDYIEDLFEEKNIDKFFLDGQTVVLEDYKEVSSKERYEKLLKLIEEGKIEVGPWYILADEFLVSGESLVRNLQYGLEITKEVKSKGSLGYLPDTFGHISQIPQILLKAGIKNALIFRGALSPEVKNYWVGADGSEIKTFVLPTGEGYFQPELLSENYLENFKNLIEKNKEYFKEEKIFILNGADHILPSKNLNEKIENVKKNLGYILEQKTGSELIEDYDFKDVKSKIYGEQRNNEKAYVLYGVTSTRSYLKRLNQEIEDRLLGIIEPLNTLFKGKFELDSYIDYLWKELIKNHAHDSICGCSIDEVHQEMEARFKKLHQGINQLLETSLKKVYKFSPEEFNDRLYLINTDPQKGTKNFEVDILVPKGLDKGSIAIFENGKEVSFDILKRYTTEKLIVQYDYLNYCDFVVYQVSLNIEFEGIEEKELEIKLTEYTTRKSIFRSGNDIIENEFLKVEVNNRGSLDIENKLEKKVYRKLNQYISTLDRGDEYTYCPPEIDMLSKAELKNSEVIKGIGFQTLRMKYILNQPEGLGLDDQSPSDRKVESEILLDVTLRAGQKEVFFKVTIDNKAKNHRLRVVFPLEESIEKVYVDSAFDIIERKVNKNRNYYANIRKEIPEIEGVALSGVLAGDILFNHRGLLEYSVEEVEKGKDALNITLLRAVGDLSKRDLQTRLGGAGPCLKTPEAQCLRKETFEYTLSFSKEKEEIIHTGKRWRVLPIAFQAQKRERKLENIWSYTNKKIILSAMKLAKDGRMMLRFFNSDNNVQKLSIEFKENVKEISICNLFGEELEILKVINNKVQMEMNKKEIVTIKI